MAIEGGLAVTQSDHFGDPEDIPTLAELAVAFGRARAGRDCLRIALHHAARLPGCQRFQVFRLAPSGVTLHELDFDQLVPRPAAELEQPTKQLERADNRQWTVMQSHLGQVVMQRSCVVIDASSTRLGDDRGRDLSLAARAGLTHSLTLALVDDGRAIGAARYLRRAPRPFTAHDCHLAKVSCAFVAHALAQLDRLESSPPSSSEID